MTSSDSTGHAGYLVRGMRAAVRDERGVGFVAEETLSAAYLATWAWQLAATTPSPRPSPDTVRLGSVQIPADVIVGALTGAVLAVITQFITGMIRNYRSYRFLLGLLQAEVLEIAVQVKQRKNHSDLMVPLYPALPTNAWNSLINAPQRQYMHDQRRVSLGRLYQAVTTANTYIYLMPTALQISQLATDERVRDTYRDETIRLLKQPLDAIAVNLPEALRALKLPRDAISASKAPAQDGA